MAGPAFNPDQYLASNGGPAPASADHNTDPLALQNFDPNAYLQQKEADEAQALQQAHGGPIEQAKAAAEGLARGASLGASDIAEVKSGLSTPEAIAGRRKANPLTSFGTELGGSIAPIALTEGAAAPLALGRVGTSALVGGVLGTGNLVTDLALGEPNLNAQKILADIGGGIVAGAGFGALEKGIAALPAILRGTIKEAPQAAESAAATVAQGTAKPVSSLEEAAERLENAKKYGKLNTDSPQAEELADALSRVDLGDFKPPEPQLEAVANPTVPSNWNLLRETEGRGGETIRGIESAQKQTAEAQLDNAIKSLSPNAEPIADAAKGGERATQAFTDQYQTEQKELGPLFKQFDKIAVNPLAEIAINPAPLEDAVEGASQFLNVEDGKLKLAPYKPSMPFSKAAHDAMGDVIEAANDPKMTLQGVRNIRNSIGDRINFGIADRERSQLMSLKKTLMDYMQEAVEQNTDDLNVRDTFKRYAINAQKREIIEKTFGSSVGAQQFGAKAMKGLANESIGDKIFANTANVRAAKEILGPEKFNEVAANWLSEYRAKATDKGIFSSNKFNSFLRGNQDALQEALSDNPALQKVKDLTTVMRILPDAASINPSGSAKTMMAMLKKTFETETLYGLAKNVANSAKGLVDRKLLEMKLNDELSATAAKGAQLKTLQNMATRTGNQIVSGAKSVWGSPLPKALAIESVERLSQSSFDDHVERINKLMGNPEALSEHLSNSTESLAHAAPNITQGIQSTMARGIQFLASKIPGNQTPYLFSTKQEPSEAERQTFGRYLAAVDKPLSALSQIKKATITPETMEALQAVHPELLSEMREKIMSSFSKEKAKDLSYSQRSAISQFLGQPLSDNMTPETALQNQMTYAQPNKSAQSAPKPTRATIGGMKNLNAAGRASTSIQEGKTDK